MRAKPLSHADLSTVVRLAPLVTLDLIIYNSQTEILLGLRNNAPAQGFYFVPGGSIWKNERLQETFTRILKNETNLTSDFTQARLLGAYEHFYSENRFGGAGYGTHCVVLAYELKLVEFAGLRADDQHSEIGWWKKTDLLVSGRVHEYTKAYFR